MNKILVYINNYQKAVEVQQQLKAWGHFALVAYQSFSPAMLKDSDYLMADWNLKDELFDCLYGRTDLGIGFYHDLFMSDIDDVTQLREIESQALQDRQWDICKGINAFYIYGDVIRRRSVLYAKPSKIQIETTDLCNAKCIMCSHAYSHGTGTDILESGVIQRIEPMLPYLKTIVLHGNGEPFLKKDIVAYLDQFAQYHIRFITNTNLSIMTDELIDALKSHFLELNVSCDAHEKQLYEYVRKGLKFSRFVANAKWVRRECPDLTMKMNVVIMRQNLPYLSDIVRFAAELGFNEILLNQLCVDPKNSNLEDDPFLYPNLYVANVEKAIQTARKCHIVIRCPQLSGLTATAETVGCPREKTEQNFIGICDWLVESPYINLQGGVAFCCINQMRILGNIFQKDMENIWNNNAYQKLRSDFYSGRLNSWCQGCDFMLQNRLRYLKLLTSDSTRIRKVGRT